MTRVPGTDREDHALRSVPPGGAHPGRRLRARARPEPEPRAILNPQRQGRTRRPQARNDDTDNEHPLSARPSPPPGNPPIFPPVRWWGKMRSHDRDQERAGHPEYQGETLTAIRALDGAGPPRDGEALQPYVYGSRTGRTHSETRASPTLDDGRLDDRNPRDGTVCGCFPCGSRVRLPPLAVHSDRPYTSPRWVGSTGGPRPCHSQALPISGSGSCHTRAPCDGGPRTRR